MFSRAVQLHYTTWDHRKVTVLSCVFLAPDLQEQLSLEETERHFVFLWLRNRPPPCRHPASVIWEYQHQPILSVLGLDSVRNTKLADVYTTLDDSSEWRPFLKAGTSVLRGFDQENHPNHDVSWCHKPAKSNLKQSCESASWGSGLTSQPQMITLLYGVLREDRITVSAVCAEWFPPCYFLENIRELHINHPILGKYHSVFKNND